MTGLADLRVDLVAGKAAPRPRRLGDHDGADRLDPLEHALLVLGRAARAAREQLREQRDDRDRHDEREQDDDDQLLRGLDRGGVRVVFRHRRGRQVTSRVAPCGGKLDIISVPLPRRLLRWTLAGPRDYNRLLNAPVAQLDRASAF